LDLFMMEMKKKENGTVKIGGFLNGDKTRQNIEKYKYGRQVLCFFKKTRNNIRNTPCKEI